jgi:hypothetical protein
MTNFVFAKETTIDDAEFDAIWASSYDGIMDGYPWEFWPSAVTDEQKKAVIRHHFENCMLERSGEFVLCIRADDQLVGMLGGHMIGDKFFAPFALFGPVDGSKSWLHGSPQAIEARNAFFASNGIHGFTGHTINSESSMHRYLVNRDNANLGVQTSSVSATVELPQAAQAVVGRSETTENQIDISTVE